MKITLSYEKRNGCIRARLYPHCDRSKKLIKLFWDTRQKCVRKTFSNEEVNQLKEVGFEVEIIGEPYTFV
jgi:hypothetical protein